MIDHSKIDALTNWVMAGCPPPKPISENVKEYCDRLVDAGLSVGTVTLFTKTINPLILGENTTWIRDSGVRQQKWSHEEISSEIYMGSPMERAEGTKRMVRYLFSENEPDLEGKVWARARSAGFAELSVLPMFNVTGTVNKVAIYGTKQAGGFTDEELTVLRKLQAPLTRVLEIYALTRDTTAILSTYVGRNVGTEVLSGKIKRGDGETISAVILFADIKGFTRISNTWPESDVIQSLNQFFDALDPAIRHGGGEILKFMGDGVLAIFPTPDDLTSQEIAAAAALKAVETAREGMASLESKMPIEFRASLHVGDVFYGNIGSEQRLDFTAIGKSVNLASRMVEEASVQNTELICSSEFFEIADGLKARELECRFKGFDETTKVYLLDE
jgi:adenylate cyclase